MTEGSRGRGGELLAQAKAQQQANRDSLLRSQQEQKDLGAIGRLGALYNSVLGGNTAGARSVATGDAPRRRPEPPTPWLISPSYINHFSAWVQQTNTTESQTGNFFLPRTRSYQFFKRYTATITLQSGLQHEFVLLEDSRTDRFKCSDLTYYLTSTDTEEDPFAGTRQIATYTQNFTDITQYGTEAPEYRYYAIPVGKKLSIVVFIASYQYTITSYVNESKYYVIGDYTPDWPARLPYFGESNYLISTATNYSYLYPSYGMLGYAQAVAKAFLVSETSIKEITIPTSLQNALDKINGTPITNITNTEPVVVPVKDPSLPDLPSQFFNSSFSYYWSQPTLDRVVGDIENTHTGLDQPSVFALKTWTPSIFESIDNIASYTAEPFRSFAKGWILPDPRTGYWHDDEPTAGSWTFDYARWPVPGEAPNALVYDPVHTADYAIRSMPRSSITTDASLFPPPTGSYTVNLTWDWDASSYCRQQLLALGFAPADLTP